MSRHKEDNATLVTMATKTDHRYGSMDNQKPPGPEGDQNVFQDGVTPVDFVLVWEEGLIGQKEEKEMSASGPTQSIKRERFLSGLREAGLLLEQRERLQLKSKVCFVLLSAPWPVLCYYAEELSLRAPLQVVQTPNYNWSEKMLDMLSIPNLMSHHVPNAPPDYYTCPFRTTKLDRFLDSDNKKTFFKKTQRHQMLYEILARTLYGDATTAEVGVERLLSEGVFSAAYPLHEGSYEVPGCVSADKLSIRQVLFQYWARWGSWYRYQPLDHIRDYFGEKIALYFAWLGFYTGWLLPAAVVGSIVFLFGFWLIYTDVSARELCDSDIIMCPLCDICSRWNLSDICFTFKVGLLFDNRGTVFFSVFMTLWSVTFLEFWKRSSSCLTHRWDCSQYQEAEERPRPEFTAMAPMMTRNPVTGAEEPYFPERLRRHRIMTGCMAIILMVSMVLMFLIAIILYRTIISVILYRAQSKFLLLSPSRIASLTGSVLNLLVILLLSRIYIALANILTRWEMHRTQSKYEDMFILKVFIFQFVNFYSSPVYIAFFKGRFAGYPGNFTSLFGVRNEDCGPGGCLIELAQELLVIMVGKQLINNVQEFISPKLKAWWQAWKGREEHGGGGEPLFPWEMDYQLLECEGLFSEYLEMVLQFGFITIFVAACPLAPLFALFNNWLEIRLDANKFVCEYRRPVAERVQNIGIWFTILQLITHLAVLSNAFMIAFSTSFVPKLYYSSIHQGSLTGYINFTLSYATNTTDQSTPPCRYRGYRDIKGNLLPEFYHLLALRLAFVIVFEHVVFLSSHMIDIIVPDVPEEVEMKIKRESYMAKQALAENQSADRTLIPGQIETDGLRRRGIDPSLQTSLRNLLKSYSDQSEQDSK